MSPAQSVEGLLDRWEAWQAEGRQVSAEELCRDCPHLLEEVKRQIRALKAMQRLVGPETGEPSLSRQATAGAPPLSLSTARDLLAALEAVALLEPSQMDELRKQRMEAMVDVKTLARELLQRGWLTAYQINKLVCGQGSELTLDDYILLDRLGSGGMGQVFKARQRRLKRLCALKVILPRLLRAPGVLERFQREAVAVPRLDHPNIVRVYDAGESRGIHYLAMEFIEGIDLAKLLKQPSRLPFPTACDYIRQACLGLQHAHEQGLVHRDIKPSNLILARQGIIKILDLGLAQVTKEASPERRALTKTGMAMGTPDYLAPEQILDAKNVDIRADLYSLGCSLYHLLAGQVPFPTDNVADKLLGQQFEQPKSVEELRPGLPAGLVGVVRRLMAKRPEHRFQSPTQVAQALSPFTQARAESGYPPTMQDRPSDHNVKEEETTGRLIEEDPLSLSHREAFNGQRESVRRTVQDGTRPAHFVTTLVEDVPRKNWVGRHRLALGLTIGMLLLTSGSIYLGLGAGSKQSGDRTEPEEHERGEPAEEPAKEETLPRTTSEQARTLHQAGLKHYQTREYNKAIDEFTKAIRIDPSFVIAYLDRSAAYDQAHQYEQAIADCDEALRLLPKEGKGPIGLAYARRGNACRHKGDANQAVADYTEAIKYDWDLAKVYYFRGVAYEMKGDRRKGQQDKAKGIKLGYGSTKK